MAYTTTNLISAIGLSSFAPNSQTTFTNANLLTFADEETQTKLVPDILAVRKEFFVTYKDYSITASQNAYDIPVRSIGMTVREVKLISSTSIIDLKQISPEEITSTSTGTPAYFYLQGNQIILYPTPSSTTDTLRVYYARRPSTLVETSSAALITAIDTATNTITVNSVPSGWSTSNTFDLIRQDGGQDCLAIDLTASNVSSTTLTLSSLPSTLRVNDYVALADQSPLVQLPQEYRSLLAKAVSLRVMMAMGLPGANNEAADLKMKLDAARLLITPRSQGSSVKFKPIIW